MSAPYISSSHYPKAVIPWKCIIDRQKHEAWSVRALGVLNTWGDWGAMIIMTTLDKKLQPTPIQCTAPIYKTNTPRKLKSGHTSLLAVSHTTLPNTYIETTYEGEGDPGYWHTCHLLAESALSLALPPPEGTSLPPLGKRGGCLTPSTGLGGVLVKRLKDSGKVRLESRIVRVEDRKRV